MSAFRMLLVAGVLALSACREHGTRLTIFTPKNDSHFAAGDTIHFAAELNSDVDPGRSDVASWRWASNRDGELGKSPRLDTPHLSPGKHVVTVTAPHGADTSRANVTVYVDSAAGRSSTQ